MYKSRAVHTIDNDTIRVNAALKGSLCVCVFVWVGVCVWGVCVVPTISRCSLRLRFEFSSFHTRHFSMHQSMEEEFHALFRLLVVKQYSIRRTHFTAWHPDNFVGHRCRHLHRDRHEIVAKILRCDCHYYHHIRVVDRPRSCCCSHADLC